jgi:hypothetical protein
VNINNIGNGETFNLSAIIFYLIGICFGTSYSMTEIDLIAWVNTKQQYKLIRTLIGAVTSIAVTQLFKLIDKQSENVTDYFFFYALPQLMTALIVYGPLPKLCVKLGLIQRREEGESIKISIKEDLLAEGS